MKRYIPFFFILSFIQQTSFSQNKSADIVVGSGFYFDKKAVNLMTNPSFNVALDYHISNKLAISSGVTYGNFKVINQDDNGKILIGLPYPKGEQFQFNIMAKHKMYLTNLSIFQLGIGLGFITQSSGYYITTKSGASFETTQRGGNTGGIPLSAELYRKVSRHLLFGVKAGTMFAENLDFVGHNIGLQLRYHL